MPSLAVDGKAIQLNDEGYLVQFTDWNEDVAKALAAEDDLRLSECHWTAINFLREYYSEYRVAPSPRVIIQAVGDKLDQRHCNGETLERLFPHGGCKHACRLAGLPDYYCHAC